MDGRSMSRRQALRLAALAPVAVAVATAPRVLAQEDKAEPPVAPHCPGPPMGLVGLVRGQQAGVGIFQHAALPTVVYVEILDITGKVLAGQQETLPPGGGIYRSYDLAAGLGKSNGVADRQMFHVMLHGPANTTIGASGEIFDAKTGQADGVFNPCELSGSAPAMTMGMIAVASGQMLRVGVFAHEWGHGTAVPPVVAKVLGSDGSVLLEAKTEVAPHAGGVIDFPVGFDVARGERFPVHVDVVHHPDLKVSASLELFDPKSGAASIPEDPCLFPDPAMSQQNAATITQGSAAAPTHEGQQMEPMP